MLLLRAATYRRAPGTAAPTRAPASAPAQRGARGEGRPAGRHLPPHRASGEGRRGEAALRQRRRPPGSPGRGGAPPPMAETRHLPGVVHSAAARRRPSAGRPVCLDVGTRWE